jgi:hypothetical protein
MEPSGHRSHLLAQPANIGQSKFGRKILPEPRGYEIFSTEGMTLVLGRVMKRGTEPINHLSVDGARRPYPAPPDSGLTFTKTAFNNGAMQRAGRQYAVHVPNPWNQYPAWSLMDASRDYCGHQGQRRLLRPLAAIRQISVEQQPYEPARPPRSPRT